MTTPTGTIGMSDVNIEIGRAYNTPINLNETPVRTLAGVSSGAISMNSLRGKSSAPAITVTVNGTLTEQNVGGNNRRSNGTFSVTVTGGTPTSYSWTTDNGELTISTPTSASTQIYGPVYQTLTQLDIVSAVVSCAVVIGGVTYTGTKSVTFKKTGG